MFDAYHFIHVIAFVLFEKICDLLENFCWKACIEEIAYLVRNESEYENIDLNTFQVKYFND